MVMCFVPDCKHYSERDTCRYYTFPKDQKEAKKWINAVRRADREPSKHSLVCSCHFKDGIKENGPSLFPRNSKIYMHFPPAESRKRKRKELKRHLEEKKFPYSSLSDMEVEEVCELHFLPSEVLRETTLYNKETGQTLSAPLKCARLKEGAIPSIMPDGAPGEVEVASSDNRNERSNEDCGPETIQVEDGSNDSITVGVSSEDEEITEIPPDDPLAPPKQPQPEDSREEPTSPGIPENITEVVKLPAEALSENLLEIGGIRKGASDDEDNPMIIDERRSRKSRTILAEVTLDDDDDSDSDNASKRKKKKGPKTQSCCNLECSSRQDLQSAPVFVLSYYGRKHKSGHPEFVCSSCYKVAQEHQEHLAYLLSQHKPLYGAEFPSRNDTVVLSDSDEEETPGEYISEDVIEDLQSKLSEVIESVTENYNVDFQIGMSKQILTDRVGNLKVKASEIENELNELQKKVDALRNGFYREFTIPTKHMGELTIDDQHHPKPPIRIMTAFTGKKTSQSSAQQMRTQQSLSGSNNSGLQSTNQQADSPRRPMLSGVAMKKVTQMQRSLSSSPVKEASSAKQEDIVAIHQVDVEYKPLPPIGVLNRPRPRVGDNVYVMKLSFYGVWVKAKILEVTPKGTELPNNAGITPYNTFKVKLESSYRKSNPVKQVTGKQLAYPTPSPVRLHVGTRVIAIFRDNEWVKECYYAGVIAEPPKSMNKFRYLVFFDDGYAQYVSHEKILVVVEASAKVWEDIHPDSRPFIRKYLEQYPERPMVKMQEGQIVKTEWNGKWWIARVVEVDCSLVKMHFDADSRTEWIYRGSTRLGPLYAELQNAAQRNVQGNFSRHRGLGVASLKKRNMPYVEYTRGTEGEEKRDTSVPSRAVAKKSTTKRPDTPDRGYEQPQYTLDKNQNFGKVEVLKLETDLKPKEFTPHQCGPACIEESLVKYTPELIRSVNPLMIPMKCGFRRQNIRSHGKKVIMYTAPCGRRLRTMVELHRYLRLTKSTMAVDLFDFDIWVNCFKEFKLEPVVASIKDLSYGKEQIPVSCVNTFDRNLPEFANYSTKRQPTEGVNLNLDPEFLIGCDCTDDCQDKDKCTCWQLTIQGTAYGPGGMVDPTVGYYYRRLPEPVMTGIYECNSKCKCAKTCLNRVVQQQLHLKLQVFMTERKGWGIRCLNDVPQGAFICIYAGNLLTEQGANEGGKNYGDEYLAELDYIEVVEKLKEGYESDVIEDEEVCNDKDKKSTPHKRTKLSSALEPQHVSEYSEEEEEEEESDEDEDDDDLMPQNDTRDSDEEFHPSSYDKSKNTAPTVEQTYMRTRLRDRTSRTASDDSDKRNDKKTKPEQKKPEEPPKEAAPKKSVRSISSEAAESDDEETGERQPSKFAVDPNTPSVDTKKPKLRSVREFFGPEEYCYIMDAKNNGNIGRYLNHSCNPNVFVQNVFVDTHDLRFPWVAFFALTYINAGTELTWDYNYDVGSVPGKVLHCYCESAECRGRLL